MALASVDTTRMSKSERREARLRQLMIELSLEPQGLSWGDAWKRILEVLPAVPEDLEKNETGGVKGETEVRWWTTNLDKAGWVLTVSPRYRLTAAGRAALERWPDAAGLAAEASAQYKAWQNLKAPPDGGPATSLTEGIALTTAGERVIHVASSALLHDGLRSGGSAFDPGRAVWSSKVVDELHAAFVGHPDLRPKVNFVDKLAGQIAQASDDAILLAAEILATLLLPLSDWKPDTKRLRVKAVLALMREPVHLSQVVSAAMDYGAFNGSLAFKTGIWRALTTTIEFARAWWRLNDSGRDRAWSDPWAWRDLTESLEGDTTPSARALLRYLRHPDAFLPIISSGDRREIREAFSDEISAVTGDLDRDLRDITIALQERSGAPVDYYAEPFVERWKPTTPPPAPRRAWLVRGSSVQGIDMVPTWLDEGFCSLAAAQLPVIDLPAEPSELRAAVDEGFGHLSYAKREEKLRDVRSFLLTMQPDDLVITTSGGKIYVGTFKGEPEQLDSEGGRSNLRRHVDWATDVEAPIDITDLTPELATRLKGGSDVVDLTDVIAHIEALLPADDRNVDGTETGPPPPAAPPTFDRLRLLSDGEADALLIGRPWLDELVELLNLRRQVILYGPPGTGKTFLAQKVANTICPRENVRLVQFHPAYAYEDFFEGYRPVPTDTGQVAFGLKAGPFRRIVDDAIEHPEQPFVLIVDEINRANLAKVFGELYFLLEYREEAIDLLYSDSSSRFSLPKNVYLIGTMNTADRSIALVDAAMRRRFAFLSLHPDDEHLRPVLRAWLARHDLPTLAADLLEELNRRIEDVDVRIGPSYLMNPGVADRAGLDRIWRTAILPLLEEHHYGDGIDVRRRYGLATLQKAIGAEEGALSSLTQADEPS